MPAMLRSLPLLVLGLLLLALVAAAAGFILRQLNLLPPEALRIAAGEPGSAYHDSALAYRDVLARDGISLEIIETDGSAENASLLDAASAVDIALVQGGVPVPDGVQGIAAVQVEPLWIFVRGELSGDPNLWAGQRVTTGRAGSGTRIIADSLARATGAGSLERSVAGALGAAAASAALLDGSVDVALMVAPVQAAYLGPLLAAGHLELLPLAHAEALALQLPAARLVRLPSGILDYRRSRPPQDVELIAVVTRLVAREGLHPALVNRLVHAVVEVHTGGGILPADRQYPAATDLGIAANGYAAQLLDEGFSPLEEILPYWIVAQFNRVLLVLLPAVLLLLPLLRLLPALYKAILGRRVFRHYARVHEIDEELVGDATSLAPARLRALRGELDAIEKRLLRANLPNTYRKQAYTLLHHLDYVRKRADTLLREQPVP